MLFKIAITTGISNAVNSSQFKYHDHLSKKLNNPVTAAKTNWSALNTFVNGSKIPLIPLLSVGNRLVIEFLAKANLFNDFFSKQCSPIVNNSSLPANLTFENENILSTFDFSTRDIVKFIKVLDPNKAPGHDVMSIRMIKLCATSISKPLHILFRNCLENESFPNEWKKASIVPAYKKIGNLC